MTPSAGPRTPDVLVLGGGGVLGEAWMSALLAGLDGGEGFDARGARSYLGTSAGSIVAAVLVAGHAPHDRLGHLPEQPPAGVSPEEALTRRQQTLGLAAELGSAAAAPLASLAFSSTAAGGALLRRSLLRRVPPGSRSLARLGRMIEQAGARWDGRLRITAVELESGRRVVFGAPGTPALAVGTAVQASCAIPGVCQPVHAAGRTYVDGGAWSPTNLDAAEVRRGDRVLCLNPTGSLPRAAGGLAAALGPVSRTICAGEALALRHRGAAVETIGPDAASASAMGADLMDRSRRDAVIAAGLAQGRRLVASAGQRAA